MQQNNETYCYGNPLGSERSYMTIIWLYKITFSMKINKVLKIYCKPTPLLGKGNNMSNWVWDFNDILEYPEHQEVSSWT